MIRRGDTVQVSIPTFLTGLNTYANARADLQRRLQQAGFSVLGIDDSALSYFGALGQRGPLIVTVVPTTADYANVNDVAGLVAGAAYSQGYDINAGQVGIVLAVAGTGSDDYRDLQVRPVVAPPPGAPNGITDLLSDLTSSPVALAVIAAAAVILVIAAKK